MENEETLPCIDKLVFDNRKAAQDTANTAEYQHGAKVKPYQCQYCHLWHLASDYSGN
jgi:cytochrome c5